MKHVVLCCVVVVFMYPVIALGQAYDRSDTSLRFTSPARYGHHLHLAVAVITATVSLHEETPEFVNMRLWGASVHYSYQSILTDELSYFVGTGSEIIARASRPNMRIPLNMMIPSIWLGMVYHTRSPWSLWIGAQYGLRWFYPLEYLSEHRSTSPDQLIGVGLKTDDYELMAMGHYYFSPRWTVFLGVGKKWLLYRPQVRSASGAQRSALERVYFAVDSWKLSCGWRIQL